MLFVCARNRLRSPTAETIFSGLPGLEVSSAGTAPDAECVLSSDLIEWADLLLVMERRQKTIVQSRFATAQSGKRVVVLGIPDLYEYMQPELVELLNRKCLPYLGGTKTTEETRSESL